MVSGHPLLGAAAVNALKECRFVDLSEKQQRYTLTIEFEQTGSAGEPGSAAIDLVLPNYMRVTVRPPEINYSTAQPAAAAGR